MAKTRIDGRVLKSMFGAGVRRVSDNVALINELNVFPVPDGDTGINLHHTLHRAWQEIANVDDDAVSTMAERFAYGALMGARGNSGTIMSQLLTGFAAGLSQAQYLTASHIVQACNSAVERAYAAVSQPVEGTILTVAREAFERLHADEPLEEIFSRIVDAASLSLKNTPDLLPRLKEAGVVDAGGMGLLYFLQGMRMALCEQETELSAPVMSEFERPNLSFTPDDDYGYDVQFVMLGKSMNVNAVRRAMEAIGWSVIVVGDASTIKVHVHVDNPAPPLDYAVNAADTLTDIVVENMQQQAIDFAARLEQPDALAGDAEIAVIAVAEGEGMQSLFRDLNCSYIIDGGPGNNPSTEDIIAAFGRCSAERIIILPNHKDVVPAAELARKLESDRQIQVVPTTNMLQGISAMIAFGDASDKGADFADMATVMETALTDISAIQITRATRSVQLNGLNIHKNDFIAIVDGEIRVAADDIDSALRDALMLADITRKEFVTVYCGSEFDTAGVSQMIERLLTTITEVEFEVIYGGQAHYPLLVSVE